jgi:hypothetical protein
MSRRHRLRRDVRTFIDGHARFASSPQQRLISPRTLSMTRTRACMCLAFLQACRATDGICEFKYQTPVLEIERATSAQTSAPIPQLLLGDFIVAGVAARDPSMALGEQPRAMIDEGDRLRCTVPCAFGTEPHTYAFTVSAPGYQDKRVEFDARYETVQLGCPGFASGPTRVQIALEPAP